MAKSTKYSGGANLAATVSKPYVHPFDRKNGPFDEYDVKNALQTLSDGHRIRKNKKLMGHVRKHAQKMIAEHKKVLHGGDVNDHDEDDQGGNT